MDLHLALKAERERQGITAQTVADYIGVSEDMVRRYDAGRSDISLRNAGRYAEALGRQLGDIVPSSRVRTPELQPLVMALQNFRPEHRSRVIEKLTRDLAFISGLTSDIAAYELEDLHAVGAEQPARPAAAPGRGKTDKPALPI